MEHEACELEALLTADLGPQYDQGRLHERAIGTTVGYSPTAETHRWSAR